MKRTRHISITLVTCLLLAAGALVAGSVLAANGGFLRSYQGATQIFDRLFVDGGLFLTRETNPNRSLRANDGDAVADGAITGDESSSIAFCDINDPAGCEGATNGRLRFSGDLLVPTGSDRLQASQVATDELTMYPSAGNISLNGNTGTEINGCLSAGDDTDCANGRAVASTLNANTINTSSVSAQTIRFEDDLTVPANTFCRAVNLNESCAVGERDSMIYQVNPDVSFQDNPEIRGDNDYAPYAPSSWNNPALNWLWWHRRNRQFINEPHPTEAGNKHLCCKATITGWPSQKDQVDPQTPKSCRELCDNLYVTFSYAPGYGPQDGYCYVKNGAYIEGSNTDTIRLGDHVSTRGFLGIRNATLIYIVDDGNRNWDGCKEGGAGEIDDYEVRIYRDAGSCKLRIKFKDWRADEPAAVALSAANFKGYTFSSSYWRSSWWGDYDTTINFSDGACP